MMKNFSSKTRQASRQWSDNFKVLKIKTNPKMNSVPGRKIFRKDPLQTDKYCLKSTLANWHYRKC